MGDLKAIEIDAEIYDQLRAYCDDVGLRFRDFVEEVLETAPTRDEDLSLIGAASETLERTDQERQRAYRRGFWDGFCASYIAMQGSLGLAVEKAPEILRAGKDPFRVPSGVQMKLFQET